jgi:chitinase
VESSLSTQLLSSFRKIFEKLHAQGEIISMAPESPSLVSRRAPPRSMRPGARLLLTSGVAAWQNPGEIEGFVEGSTNAYVPLVDTTVVNHVSWVAPQLYNDLIPFGEDPVKYVTSLQAGHTIEWDGKTIEVKVPSNKIVLGHPATRGAAPARNPPDWQSDPEALLKLYKSSPELMATKGVMTWSVGHDYGNGWKWIKAVKQIWEE